MNPELGFSIIGACCIALPALVLTLDIIDERQARLAKEKRRKKKKLKYHS